MIDNKEMTIETYFSKNNTFNYIMYNLKQGAIDSTLLIIFLIITNF